MACTKSTKVVEPTKEPAKKAAKPPKIILYMDFFSQPSRSLFMFMKLANIPFEVKEVNVPEGQNREDWYKKINPFCTVPYITDHGEGFSESMAMIAYVGSKYNAPEALFPMNDHSAQAKVNSVFHWQHTGMRKQCMAVFVPMFRDKLGVGTFTHQPLDDNGKAAVEKAKEDARKAVQQFADVYLQNGPFVLGKNLSVADLVVFNELAQLDVVGMKELYMGNKKVAKWAEEVLKQTKSVYEEAHKKRLMVEQMFKEAAAK